MDCYGTDCKNKATHKVEKKGDLSHRKGYYCDECVKPYKDSDEGKKYFIVTPSPR